MDKPPTRNVPALLITILASAIILSLGWVLINHSAALAGGLRQSPFPGESLRQERDERPDTPTISFIDSRSPACTHVDRERDICTIRFNYLYVTASDPQYIISMSVRIDNRMRAYYSGFFQDYMYLPADMNAEGFQVRCGPLGSGGNPYWGKSYAFTIRARETGGLSAANYGTVYCPAGPRVIHLPLVRKN